MSRNVSGTNFTSRPVSSGQDVPSRGKPYPHVFELENAENPSAKGVCVCDSGAKPKMNAQKRAAKRLRKASFYAMDATDRLKYCSECFKIKIF